TREQVIPRSQRDDRRRIRCPLRVPFVRIVGIAVLLKNGKSVVLVADRLSLISMRRHAKNAVDTDYAKLTERSPRTRHSVRLRRWPTSIRTLEPRCHFNIPTLHAGRAAD